MGEESQCDGLEFGHDRINHVLEFISSVQQIVGTRIAFETTFALDQYPAVRTSFAFISYNSR